LGLDRGSAVEYRSAGLDLTWRIGTQVQVIDSTGRSGTKQLVTPFGLVFNAAYLDQKTKLIPRPLGFDMLEGPRLAGFSLVAKADFRTAGFGLGAMRSHEGKDHNYTIPALYLRVGDPAFFYYSLDNSFDQPFCTDGGGFSYGAGQLGRPLDVWLGYKDVGSGLQDMLVLRLRHGFGRYSVGLDLGTDAQLKDGNIPLWLSLGLGCGIKR
jgi:hypothetical protein